MNDHCYTMLIEKMITKFANVFVVIALSAMIVLAFVQIILRNFFASGISWADVTVRHLVLWVGFFGAILAAIQERHITLDVFSRVIPLGAKKYINSILHFATAGVCFILAHASYKFVASEKLMGEILFAGVPVFWAQTIIPFTFAVIGVLYLLRGMRRFCNPDLKVGTTPI